MKKGSCPVCKKTYLKSNYATHHHVFPKEYYNGSGPIAELCLLCHREFEKKNPHEYVWTKKECWERWANFLLSKGITTIHTGIIYNDRRK